MQLWNDARLRLSITRLGLEYLAILLLLGLFAVNSGNNLLYLVFSLMLGLLLVSGWASVRALEGLTLLGVEEGNVFARVKGGVKVRLADAHPGRPRGLEVLLQVDGARVDTGFHGGGAGRGDVQVVLQVRPEARGWCPIRDLELRTRYPFGFLEKTRRLPLDQAILALPHPRATEGGALEPGDRLRSLFRPGSAQPAGSRPFRLGDPLTRIHWKRTAQRGEPWVRELEDEGGGVVVLALDLGAFEPGKAFERHLEHLSGAILQARIHRKGVVLDIQGGEHPRQVAGHREAWRALALAEAVGQKRATLNLPHRTGVVRELPES